MIKSKSDYRKILNSLTDERDRINDKLTAHFEEYVKVYDVVNCTHRQTSEDRNGDTVLMYCSHKGNKHDHEGNCTQEYCPFKLKVEQWTD